MRFISVYESLKPQLPLLQGVGGALLKVAFCSVWETPETQSTWQFHTI